MVRKVQDWQISSRNRVYHLYKSVPCTRGKRLARPETGIKDGFEEMEHKFPFGIFHPQKQDYFFRCSVALGNFPLEDPKSRVPFTFQLDFPEIFVNNQFHGPDYLEVWKRLIIKENVRTE